jgi:predicted transcriptional regulator of viral defense system
VRTLKRGLYTLCDEDRAAKFSRHYLANQLYMPSYISLESALSYYNIIPEGVYAITSVSSKKTQQFNNAFGQFIYHHVDPELFGDFVLLHDEFNNPVYIASKERAIIDFLYLKVPWARKYDHDIFTLSYRFQNLQDVDIEKLRTIAKKFKQDKIQRLLEVLIAWIFI